VQLFLRNLRNLGIPIGVAASRYEAGSLLETQFPVDLHLLDDGFQHLALRRDLDLVLVDAENPWGRRGSFRSLLREAPQALGRADAMLLTRTEIASASASNADTLEALQASLQGLNPGAPRFAVRTQLLGFRELQSNSLFTAEQLQSRRPLAFCALGNPRAFFRTLDQAGISVAGKKVFPDHHRYSERDLTALVEAAAGGGADCLLTTEKDLVNLPPGVRLDLPLYWAGIELHVEEESRLLQWIGERLELPVLGGSPTAVPIGEPARPLWNAPAHRMANPLRKDELAQAKILIRPPNWIGDAVMCLPALHALRRALPEAELVVAARPWVLDLFSGDALGVRTVAYNTHGAHRGIAGRWRMASELRGEKFDAALLFQNAFDAALLAVLAGIPIRAGYARHGRRWLLTHPVPVPRRGETPRQEAHYYLELLRRLGLIEGYFEVRDISLPAADSA
ncbi:MAG: tetraacyldisaccharide 4'-kinase, partial [Terriglobia bacterium]